MRSFLSTEIRWLEKQVLPLMGLNLFGLFLILGASMLTLLDPLIMKWLIDDALAKRSVHLLFLGVIGFAAAYFGQLAFSYAASLVGFIVSRKMVFRIRVGLIHRLHVRSAQYYTDTPVGEILYRVERDVDLVGELAGDFLPSLIRMAVVGVMVLVTMALVNVRLTLMVAPLLPLFYFLQRRYLNTLKVAAENAQRQMGVISSFLQEHLSGMLQLQLLNRTGTHGRKFARALAAGASLRTTQRLAELRFSAVSMSVIVLGSALILGFGGYDVIRHRLTVGGLVAFYSYVIRLFGPMSIAVDLQSRMKRGGASIRRIVELAGNDDTAASNGHQTQRLIRTSDSTQLEFRNVCFSYARGQSVLDCICFSVREGEKVALFGPSGCGKSTIAQLATRLYDPDAGSVLIDGLDVRNLGQRNVRSVVTAVPQEPVLFNATLRENLLYGDPAATSRDLERVIFLAQLEDVIRALPRGLDEALGPMGQKLSGGEKKRVAFARAFLQLPKILILDEVTSGLDGPTAARMLEGLDRFRDSKSVILISHKASEMLWVDRILVMERGRIIDQGKHDELMHRCELYRKLHRGKSLGSSTSETIETLECQQ
jgi:ATP-binding cassette, subfamily B, bacterial